MEFRLDTQDSLLHDPHRTWALLRLWIRADAAGEAAFSLRQLAADWGLSRERTAAILRELEAGGWIAAQKGSGRRATRYRLTGRGIARRDLGNPPNAAEPPSPAAAAASPAPRPPSDASRLVRQHAARYTDRFGQPFPVAWARDTQIYKRLVATYGAEAVERWQTRYLAQPLDSFAAKRGFSVPQFAADIPAMAAREAIRHRLDAEQAALAQALQDAGLADDTALALVTSHPADAIRDQLQAHHWRQQRGQTVSPSRLERAIRERWAVPEDARPVAYPLFPAGPAASPSAGEDPAPETLKRLLRTIVVKMS